MPPIAYEIDPLSVSAGNGRGPTWPVEPRPSPPLFTPERLASESVRPVLSQLTGRATPLPGRQPERDAEAEQHRDEHGHVPPQEQAGDEPGDENPRTGAAHGSYVPTIIATHAAVPA
jgi:hypothetical protein